MGRGWIVLRTGKYGMFGLRRLARDEAGASAVEYGLIVVGISAAILNVLQSIGANLRETWTLFQGAVQ